MTKVWYDYVRFWEMSPQKITLTPVMQELFSSKTEQGMSQTPARIAVLTPIFFFF